MTSTNIDRIARVLLDARREHRCADADSFATALDSPEQAYAVQAIVARSLGWKATGAAYCKSGGPSREAQ